MLYLEDTLFRTPGAKYNGDCLAKAIELTDFDEQELITSSIRHPNIVQLMGFTLGPRPGLSIEVL